MTLGIRLHMILFLGVALALFLAVSEFIRGRKSRSRYFYACFACSSSWWSLCVGVMFLQTDPNMAYVWRCLGLIGVLAYLILFTFLNIWFIEPPKWLAAVMAGFSLLGILVYPIAVSRENVIYEYIEQGMTHVLVLNWKNLIYAGYKTILLLLLLGSISYMLTRHRKKGTRLVDVCMILSSAMIAVGTVMDTIMPMFGKECIPGSSIIQIFGVLAMYRALQFVIHSRLNMENMSTYIYYSLTTPIYICDEKLQLKIVNQAGYQFLGMEKEEALKLNLHDFFFWGGGGKLLQQEYAQLQEVECLINHRICNVNINQIRDYFGDLQGYILVVTDLSDKIRYMEELEDAKKKAEAANVSKSMFLANMSHEIRTPMHAIIGFSEIIMNLEVSDEVRENIGYVRESAYNLLAIINDILDFSKIETGKMEVQEVPYFTSSLLRGSINVISNQAKAKGLEFEVDTDENIPKKLYGDKVRVRSVLINVLNNAIKYTKKGGVHFSVRCSKVAEDQVECVFTVKDTGVGMHQEDISRMFQAFERFNKKEHYGVEGSGLGLAICNAYVALMGGRIEVESVYGEGSTFRVILRQKVLEWEAMDKEYLYHYLPSKRKLRIRNQKILVVDDNLINRMVAEGILSTYGGQVDMADGGKSAIDACKKKEYDLIFMDQMMPEIDGTMALKEIRKISPYYSEKALIIVLTAEAIAGMKEKFLAEGFDEYLAKPIEVTKLERILRQFVPEDCLYYE